MYDTIKGLNPQQADAVQTVNGPMLILAGAGSGKTKVLTCRIAHLLNQGVRPYRILAITFTNKAAAEMRERVDKMAGEVAKDVWLHTFHAFCAKLLRMEIDKLGTYTNNFAIYDTADTKSLIKQVLDELNLDEKRFQPSGVITRISNAKNQLQSPEEFAN
jgi:DNA helicase-2/ATP-dependent DNA helicase PcrA